MEQGITTAVDDHLGAAGKTHPQKHVFRVEADASETVRGEDVINGNCLFVGQNLYALEPGDG